MKGLMTNRFSRSADATRAPGYWVQGFTLVEMLVGLAVSSIVMAVLESSIVTIVISEVFAMHHGVQMVWHLAARCTWTGIQAPGEKYSWPNVTASTAGTVPRNSKTR